MGKTNCQILKTDSTFSVAGFLRFAHPATVLTSFLDPAAHPGPVNSDVTDTDGRGLSSHADHIIALNTGCEGGPLYNKEGA